MEALFPLSEVVTIVMFLVTVVFLLVYAMWDSPYHRRSGHSHRLFATRERLIRHARR